jgi:PTH1 family peptidyl-tRNA hydrolase
MVLDELAEKFKAGPVRGYKHSAAAKMEIEGYPVLLLKPLTYMNRSGAAVRELLSKKNIQPEKIIIVHDDIDMETGRLKVRRGGSSGGHRGVESIIVETGRDDFIRVKIGVGRDPFLDPEKYVLGKFKKDEEPVMKEAIQKAALAVECIITEGITCAMNRFNKKG